MHTIKYPHNERIARGPALPRYWTHHYRIEMKLDELNNENLNIRWQAVKDRNDLHELIEFEAQLDQLRKP